MATPFLRSSVRASLFPIGAALLVACAPAAAPSPTAPPAVSGPTSAPAKPDAPKAEAPKPAGAAAQQAATSKPDTMAALTALYEKARGSGQTKVSHYGAGLNEFEPIVEAF